MIDINGVLAQDGRRMTLPLFALFRAIAHAIVRICSALRSRCLLSMLCVYRKELAWEAAWNGESSPRARKLEKRVRELETEAGK